MFKRDDRAAITDNKWSWHCARYNHPWLNLLGIIATLMLAGWILLEVVTIFVTPKQSGYFTKVMVIAGIVGFAWGWWVITNSIRKMQASRLTDGELLISRKLWQIWRSNVQLYLKKNNPATRKILLDHIRRVCQDWDEGMFDHLDDIEEINYLLKDPILALRRL